MVDMVIPEYEETPPPIVRTQQSDPARLAQEAAEARDEYCQRVCAEGLVYAAANQTWGMDVEDAWAALKTMPLSCLDWLYTPDGWAILIDGLRQGLGYEGPTPRVTVH